MNSVICTTHVLLVIMPMQLYPNNLLLGGFSDLGISSIIFKQVQIDLTLIVKFLTIAIKIIYLVKLCC